MTEVLAEALHEITARPLIFGLEVLQFAILVLLVKAVAFGFGKRRGVVQNMLAERQRSIAASLEEAVAADARRAEVDTQVARIAEDSAEQVRRIVADAESEAASVRERALVEARAEADRLKRQTREVLDREFEEMLAEVRDELVDVVTKATRRILDEGLSPAEQRALIQREVLESVREAEAAPEPVTTP